MRRGLIALAAALLVVAPSVSSRAAPQVSPDTPRRPVEDHYYDTTVRDDYRWLESWSDSTVRAWSDAQNERTRAALDQLPMRPAVLRRVDALSHTVTPTYSTLRYCQGAWFAIKNQPPKQQPMLVRLASLTDLRTEKVIVDPNQMDPSGSTAIDFYVPTLDGQKVAVSLSTGGSENGTVHVFDGRTGTEDSDVVPRVNYGTAGGSVVWNADHSGFYRTRYPLPGEHPAGEEFFFQQIWFHRLGTPESEDHYVAGREFPKIAEIVLSSSDDGRWVLADVLNGDGGEHSFWLAGGEAARTGQEGAFHPLTRFQDKIVPAKFGPDALFLLSRQDSPNGRILRLPLATPELARAVEIVPQSREAIEWFTPTASRLYVEEIVGGPSKVRVFRHDGRPDGEVALPTVSTVTAIVKTEGDQVVLERQSYTEPPRWSGFDPARRTLTPTALVTRSPARFDDVVVRREWAVSKDGTRVPVNILMRRGTRLDGSAPTLITGYGGYGLSQRPGFNSNRRLWLDQGGIIAITNTRGGGEFGDAWHLDGNLTKKQHVFDDFAACAQLLVDHHYTRPQRLAAQGGSNGGLLMGAMITQHPELFRAIVASVGIYDMLRVELSPNGLFNITEFGTVKDSAQFVALYAYSPYHHVVDGVKYPAVLFTTGANDPRVDPMNSRKMTARLQAATASEYPILLRTSAKSGHGIGSSLSERNGQSADIYSFLFHELGVDYKEPLVTKGVKPTLSRDPHHGRVP